MHTLSEMPSLKKGKCVASKIISSNGYEILVDADDFERLNKYSWWVSVRGKRIGVFRSTKVNGKSKTIQMHREIMQPGAGLVVDHINRNRLDNRRSNLRICTQFENARNVGPASHKKYKGTIKEIKGKSVGWHAKIRCGGKQIYLGYFKDEESAARAYDKAASKLHGEFAYLNFPSIEAEMRKEEK